MVTIVFTLAILNLGLGMAFGIALHYLPGFSITPARTTPRQVAIPTTVPPPTDALTIGPTDDWRVKLRAMGLEPQSRLEELLWISKLEVASLRNQLLSLEDAHHESPDSLSINGDFRRIIEGPCAVLDRWAELANDAKNGSADATTSTIAHDLEELLLDHGFQLRGWNAELEAGDQQRIARLVNCALDDVHAIRDRIDSLLHELLEHELRLSAIPDRFRTTSDDRILSRLGLAALFDRWWSDDPDGVRLVSVAMLDLDRFGKFVQRVGHRRADIVLDRLSATLHDLMRKERGFDRIARFAGQRFAAFMGDTSIKNAMKGAERIRQTIEATSCMMKDEALELTARVAVIEVGKHERPQAFLRRLENGLTAAKREGRNCVFADQGSGPQRVELPQYPVQMQVYSLDDASAGQ